ncbi:MAG: hypothetical protein ACK42L_09010, partial [Thermoanaerobaculum sp.]
MVALTTLLVLAQVVGESPQVPGAREWKVETRASKSWEFRQQVKREPRCVPVPRNLWRSGAEVIGEGFPAGGKLAGSGDTLGILEPHGEGSFRLRLWRRGRMVEERFLRVPEGGFLTTPRLVLGERGDWAALVQVEGFAVYAGAQLVGVFRDEDTHAPSVAFLRGEVHWCPSPHMPKSDRREWKAHEMPPLWLKAEVDGGRREVLLRADPDRLDPADPQAQEWSLDIAVRRDGKLWLVGASSGEVLEASATGSILRRFVPYRFPPKAAQDPTYLEEAVQEAKKKAEELLGSVPAFTDATKKPGVVTVRFSPWSP